MQNTKKQKTENEDDLNSLELISWSETKDEENERFLIELEFVQCLANPGYLNFLSQTGVFDDPAFINYLEYLQYWKQPQYASFIVYPNCLKLLDLLQDEDFRKGFKDPGFADFIHREQYYHWRYYRNNRLYN